MLRRFKAVDWENYLILSRDFYASAATDHPVPESHFQRTFAECVAGSPLACGWMIENGNGQPVGYMLASFKEVSGYTPRAKVFRLPAKR